MFRASPDSSQIDLFSNVERFLRERDQAKLSDPTAWHNVFLDQVVKCVPETRFAELFDDATGRPNAPLRMLVGMLILKEGFGWSDEELFEAVHFNLLVRRALGLLNLTDEVPVESTYYLFKQRLYAHQLEMGVNLLQEVFQELTRDQARRLGVVGEKLRMDSTLLGSNLAACTRLQLIIGCLQAFCKSLTDEQKAGLSEADRALLERLCAKRPSQHIYRLEETAKQAWLDELGQVLLRLHQTDDLKSSPRYALIERLLLEQYQLEDADEQTRVALKPTQEISADSLQSPHDEDAAYRKKRDETVRGYSVNLTETCQEPLNLIVDVQVEPATAADNGYLKEAVQSSEQVLETTAQEISADGKALLTRLAGFFTDYTPVPSLLHGDLWGGNFAAAEGEPVIYDPAVYYGDRETDIAMAELFGGFGPDFHAAYEEAWPLDDGYALRRDLYQLYHVLNHLNLFGGAYLSQARALLRGLLAA